MARRRIPAWVRQEMRRAWKLDGEYVGDGEREKLSPEEERKLQRSKAQHPSRGQGR